MIKRLSILILMLIGGCITPATVPPRWQIGVPVAMAETMPAGTVWLRHDGKRAEDGNSYDISFIALTNATADSRYTVDLATNRLPAKRFHIDLSIDGGSNWIRRIGYGVQADQGMTLGTLRWSPPEDYSLLTSNAMLRAVSLENGPFPARSPAMPYDVPARQYPVSFPFQIVGATIDTPSGGILWRGNGVDLNWRQLGGGSVWNLYWLTPQSAGIDVAHWITTISNVVVGANYKRISLNVPDAPAVRLAIVSVQHPSIIGYSKTFTVDP